MNANAIMLSATLASANSGTRDGGVDARVPYQASTLSKVRLNLGKLTAADRPTFGYATVASPSPSPSDGAAPLAYSKEYLAALRSERRALVATDDQRSKRRLALVEWMLDQAEMAELGDDLQRLNQMATGYEALADELHELTKSLRPNSPSANPTRRQRGR